MRMQLKFICFLALALIALCALSACNKKSSAHKTVVIGADLELTGAVATAGQGAKEGIELAVSEQNRNGGLFGKQIELVVLDNKSDPVEAANQAEKLITEQHVLAILGPVTSGNSKAAAPIAQDGGVVLFTPTATNPAVTPIGTFIFRACFLDSFQGQTLARFAHKQLKASRMAVLVENGNDYAKGLGEFTAGEFSKLGGQVVSQEYYSKDEKDFTPILTKIKSAQPDVIIVPAYYETVGLCIKQAREMGYTVPILGGDGWDSPKLVEIAGAKNLNNTYFTNHYSSQDPATEVQTFVHKYQAQYHKIPDTFAALGYDTAGILFDAIRRANAMDSEKIRAALAQTKDFHGVTGAITMGADRNPIKSISVLALKDGQQRLVVKMAPQ